MKPQYKSKIFLFGILCYVLNISVFAQQNLSPCYIKHASNHKFIVLFYIPVNNEQQIKKIFPKVPISKDESNINIQSLTTFSLKHNGKIFHEKRNGTLAFNIIHGIWNYTLPMIRIIKFNNNPTNTLSDIKQYIGYINDFTAHTNYSYNYNHYDNKKTQLIYVFYHGNTAWLSLPYMVGLNDQKVLNIKYLNDYCS